MKQVVITITVPDGVEVAVAQTQPATQPIIPPMQAAPQGHEPKCPVHGSSHLIPAGTSKSSGKKYSAFWGCEDRDCQWRVNA